MPYFMVLSPQYGLPVRQHDSTRERREPRRQAKKPNRSARLGPTSNATPLSKRRFPRGAAELATRLNADRSAAVSPQPASYGNARLASSQSLVPLRVAFCLGSAKALAAQDSRPDLSAAGRKRCQSKTGHAFAHCERPRLKKAPACCRRGPVRPRDPVRPRGTGAFRHQALGTRTFLRRKTTSLHGVPPNRQRLPTEHGPHASDMDVQEASMFNKHRRSRTNYACR